MEADGSILCEVAALNDTDPATPLMLYAEDYYAGCPAAAVHAFGKGQAYYLASRFNADFYNDFMRRYARKQTYSLPGRSSCPPVCWPLAAVISYLCRTATTTA